MHAPEVEGVSQAAMTHVAEVTGSGPPPDVTGHIPQHRTQHIIGGQLLRRDHELHLSLHIQSWDLDCEVVMQ